MKWLFYVIAAGYFVSAHVAIFDDRLNDANTYTALAICFFLIVQVLSLMDRVDRLERERDVIRLSEGGRLEFPHGDHSGQEKSE